MSKENNSKEFQMEAKRVAKSLAHATAEAEKRYNKAMQDYNEAVALNDMPAIEIKNKYPEIWTGLLKLEQSIQDKESKKQDK